MTEHPESVSDGERIVVGVDGSEHAKDALREAARLAGALDLPLEVVTCWQDVTLAAGAYGYIPSLDPEDVRTGSQKMVEDVLAEVFGEDRPQRLRVRLWHGRPAEALIKASEGARMLVVGSRGHGGVVGMLLGSVSSAVVSHATCPVLVVHR
ncbi:universal stress protein UspA [Kocuria flava]|uniref:Universal stress protein UspA n=1 Tax=Kocuria flava TaxID=446860 RepID=A0A2N4T4S6_9MICC|nr:universal stress protein [Kocuria flava]PLC13227.1 universal stress protein UspA [Kocuria flava]